jgi:hypothetical protein
MAVRRHNQWKEGRKEGRTEVYYTNRDLKKWERQWHNRMEQPEEGIEEKKMAVLESFQKDQAYSPLTKTDGSTCFTHTTC